MPYRLVTSLFIVLFYSCGPQVKEEPVVQKLDIRLSVNELDSLKSFIIQEYWKYDSAYFTTSDNCYFRQFVENELESFGYHYESVYRGMSIKHYRFPYTNFKFNLVRGSDGRFYYISLSDMQYVVEDLVEDEYSKVDYDNYELLDKGEMSFNEIRASTALTFNKIFEQDTLFRFFRNSKSFSAIWNARGFVFQNYKQYTQSGNGLVPMLNNELNSQNLKSVMEEFKGQKLSEKEIDLAENYGKLTYYFMDKKVDLYYEEKIGILSFLFKKEVGRITFEERLFPAKERPYISLFGSIDSLIDWSLYPECRP